MFFDVYLKDRVSGLHVGVGGMLSRSECLELRRVLEKYNACDVLVIGYHFEKGKVVYDET